MSRPPWTPSITIDESSTVVLFNPAAELMFRCPAKDVLGKHINQLIRERHRKTHDAHISRFGKGGTTERRMGSLGSISGLRADGEEFPIEASISQVDIEGEKLFTVILRDVTERKTSEEARMLLTREVDHRAKNALAIVQALVTLTRADSIESYGAAIKGRIASLARAHSLLSQSQWRGASLIQVVGDELAPYAKENQMTLGGIAIELDADAVQPLSLMFHDWRQTQSNMAPSPGTAARSTSTGTLKMAASISIGLRQEGR